MSATASRGCGPRITPICSKVSARPVGGNRLPDARGRWPRTQSLCWRHTANRSRPPKAVDHEGMMRPKKSKVVSVMS
jgi:hypothetical protein